MKEKPFYKKAKGLIGVIFIGILTSSLWELVFKDLLFFIGNLFVETASLFYKNYIDNIYTDVGKGDYFFLTLPSIAIIVFVIMFPVFSLIFLKYLFLKYDYKNKINSSQNIENRQSFILKTMDYLTQKKWRIYLLILLISLPNSIIYIDSLISDISSISAYRNINRKIDIVKPYITQREYDLLKSEMLQINSKNKVINIIRNLNNVALKNHISFEEKKLIGIGQLNEIK